VTIPKTVMFKGKKRKVKASADECGSYTVSLGSQGVIHVRKYFSGFVARCNGRSIQGNGMFRHTFQEAVQSLEENLLPQTIMFGGKRRKVTPGPVIIFINLGKDLGDIEVRPYHYDSKYHMPDGASNSGYFARYAMGNTAQGIVRGDTFRGAVQKLEAEALKFFKAIGAELGYEVEG